MRKSKNISLTVLFTNILLCLFLSVNTVSCIKDADDEEQPTPPEDTPVATDSTAVQIDSTFVAKAEYMVGEWMAQYAGYDPQQSMASGSDVVSSIRRLVFFSPDGFYDSHVQGIVNTEDTITLYKEFEHEYGTFAFDEERQMMTYTVEYDSLLNFNTDQMEYHNGKLKGPVTIPQYGERIWFSGENDGLRDWIREDDNLMSVEEHTARLIYSMKRQQ
mgnify:FL=1